MCRGIAKNLRIKWLKRQLEIRRIANRYVANLKALGIPVERKVEIIGRKPSPLTVAAALVNSSAFLQARIRGGAAGRFAPYSSDSMKRSICLVIRS